MHELAPKINPVTPDGDAVIRYTGGIDQKMNDIFDKAMLPDGTFAVTDMTEHPNGAFVVQSDKSGQLLAESLIRQGENPATVRAYGERLHLVANPELYKAQSISRGESRILTKEPETVLINGTGKLGKPNLIGLVNESESDSPDTKRSHGIVERNGLVFIVTKTEIPNDYVDYTAAEVIEDGPTPANLPFITKIRHADNQSSLAISSEDPKLPALIIPSTERLHEQEKAPKVRGILRGKRKLEQNLQSIDVDDFDLDLADQVIQTELDSQENMQRFLQQEAAKVSSAEADKKNFEDSVDIEKLSQKHPEAGNIFHPGSTIYQDELFIATLESLGIGNTVVAQGQRTINLSDKDQDTLRENPEARQVVKQLIRDRLNAWITEHPAQSLQLYFGADQKLDTHLEPSGLARNPKGNSMLDYAFSNKRTIANLLIPEGVARNRSKQSSKRHKRGDDKVHLASREYVTNIAFDLLSGDFGDEEGLYGDVRYIDGANNVIIHAANIAQHRTAARLLVYGDC